MIRKVFFGKDLIAKDDFYDREYFRPRIHGLAGDLMPFSEYSSLVQSFQYCLGWFQPDCHPRQSPGMTRGMS